jgi:isopentenyl phosphate kinase
VLSGDCLISADGTLQLFGSDRVPQVLLQCVQPPVRVVALTDTPGVLVRRGSTDVLPSVDPNDPTAAFQVAWSGGQEDTTAGMIGKLEALVEAARMGAECFIMKGHPEARTLAHLLEPIETWPADQPRTRIACP